MTKIRKFLYSGLLALSIMSLAPSGASAQELAHGKFTLPHEVHWQNAVIPAGDYLFSLAGNGASGMLTLSKTTDAQGGFMILVNDIDDFAVSGANQLVIDSTPNGSYVRSLELPKFGVTLHFVVPSSGSEKPIARGTNAHLATGQ